MPKINEILLKLEGFWYATSLDLNMVYYHIRLRENTSNLCTIILLWRKYQYKRLPLGVDNLPDIFQQKVNDLFHRFYFIRAYIYNLFILTKWDWTDHLQKLELTINKLKGGIFKCNIEKSFFGQTEMEYFGFWVTCDSVKSINKKIEAVTNMIHLLPKKK